MLLTLLGLVSLNIGVVAARSYEAGLQVWPYLGFLFLLNLGGVLWTHFWVIVPLNRELVLRQKAMSQTRRHAHEVEDLYHRSPCGYLSLDRQGKITQVNNTALTWLSRRREEVVGQPWVAFLTRGSAAAFTASFTTLQDEGSARDQEFQLLRSDGSLTYILLRSIAVLDPTTRQWMCRSAFVDITERRKSEERLAEVSARLQAVLSGATEVAIIAYDLEGRITVFNSGAERMLGYRCEEMLGREGPWSLHLSREILDQGERLSAEFGRPVRGFDVLVERVRKGTYEEREWRLVRKDGVLRTVNLVMTGMKNAEGKLVGFLAIGTDVTERNQVREWLHLAMTAARIGTWDWDIVADRMTRSENAFETLGLPGLPADLSIEGLLEHVLPEDRQGLRDALDATLSDPARENRYQAEFRLRAADGSVVSIEDRGRVFRDDSGKPIRMMGTHMDVTRRRAIDEQLRKARDAAERANQAKTTFLANLSHEIRTPLGGIIGMVELLAQTPLNPQQTGFVEAIVTSGEALLALVNDVLDISKIESGKGKLERIPFDLWQASRDALRVLSARALQKGLRLEFEAAPDLPCWVVGDLTRLRQVLINLIGNAIKFTPAGEVRVRVRPVPDGGQPADRGPLPPGEHLVEFSVSDTGIGIPPDQLQVIFNPFEQAANGSEGADLPHGADHGGTGLGLAISSRLVRWMGGTLDVVSEVGKGSTFTFSIPFVPIPEPSERPPAQPAAGEELPPPAADEGPRRQPAGAAEEAGAPRQPPKARILLVEDNFVNQQVMLLRLQNAGYAVSVANNGREAVEMFEKGNVDLILMDLQMPEMDGVRATRLIRAREKVTGGHVPIIAVTANVLETERQRCLIAGMDEYLRKPVRSPELFQTVARLLGHAYLADPSAPSLQALASHGSAPAHDPLLGANAPAEALADGAKPPAWLEALLAMNFGAEPIGRLVQAFVNTVPERITALTQAVESGDALATAQMAHSLKGSLAVFAAADAAEVAQRLERLGREGNMHEAVALLGQLRHEVEGLLASMQAHLQTAARA